MTAQEHKTLVDRVMGYISEENKAKASADLLQIENDYKETLAKQADSDKRVEFLEKQNKDYAEVNTQLFLNRKNTATEEDQPHSEDTPDTPDTPPEKRKYEDLVFFDKNGG